MGILRFLEDLPYFAVGEFSLADLGAEDVEPLFDGVGAGRHLFEQFGIDLLGQRLQTQHADLPGQQLVVQAGAVAGAEFYESLMIGQRPIEPVLGFLLASKRRFGARHARFPPALADLNLQRANPPHVVGDQAFRLCGGILGSSHGGQTAKQQRKECGRSK